MKALLLYPEFPQSFWSYDRFMEIAGLKAVIPPLGIITVAALLPQNWVARERIAQQLGYDPLEIPVSSLQEPTLIRG